jgi:hypothetical protein
VYAVKGSKMMYNQKLVASIKVNGKILREFKDQVYIPFGSEYSFLIKNLNTVRAVVNVFVDGKNAVPGGLVVDPGRSVDLERWIKNGNLTAGNRFKFIERTAAIEDGPRGIKQEDGLVRIEYQFEIPRPVFNISDVWGHTGAVAGSSVWGNTGAYYGTNMPRSFNVNGALRGVDYSAGESTKAAATAAINSTLQSMNISASGASLHDGMATMDSFANDVGITVPGSKSDQKFTETTVGALDPAKHTIVLHLVGDLGHNKPVDQPVTVKHKPKCVTCGKQNKATAKFCTECGTALEIFA